MGSSLGSFLQCSHLCFALLKISNNQYALEFSWKMFIQDIKSPQRMYGQKHEQQQEEFWIHPSLVLSAHEPKYVHEHSMYEPRIVMKHIKVVCIRNRTSSNLSISSQCSHLRLHCWKPQTCNMHYAFSCKGAMQNINFRRNQQRQQQQQRHLQLLFSFAQFFHGSKHVHG